MSKMSSSSSDSKAQQNLYRIPPYFYIHVLDQNSNITRVEEGPMTFIRQDNEKVIIGPERMITVPPRHYCIVSNPVLRDEKGDVVFAHGQAKLRYGDTEIRLTQEPFPLYPGENVVKQITALAIVNANAALRLQAVLDFADEKGIDRVAGDEWLFEGPGTYLPRVEVQVVETLRATIIRPQQALRLRARKDCTDREGNKRVTGEEWIVRKVGAYLPGADEEVVKTVDAFVLTDKKALHLSATRSFVDDYKVERKSGEEWLITLKDTETHIPSVYEEVIGVVPITTLTNREYAIVVDPVGEDGKPQLGQKKLVRGEMSFFLLPGESLEGGVQGLFVLGEDEGLILRANEQFKEGNVAREPGDRWMIRGPAEYVPPCAVTVVQKRKAIPLDENEGIYVRDTKTGRVRSVCGQTYMLNENEELWSKELPKAIEDLLAGGRDPVADRNAKGSSSASSSSSGSAGATSTTKRDKTRVINFRVPHNAAVQIYDYKEKKARVAYGPDLVMLGPDEQFTQLSLSGGKPKRPNQIRSLVLLLGPDFCTDVITIETADHARLQLQLSYNWHFDVDRTGESADAEKIFSVPDFVGDACKAIASRVRGAVAAVNFDDFHKNSAKIIRSSVFGVSEDGKVRDRFCFPANKLVITSIDIQSVEPVDQRTRDALQKSVQLAIEITTNSQEATARHEAERLEQEAKGRLERQKINDEAEAEKSRKELLLLQAASAAVESTGQAKAEAQSRAEAARIEGEAAVEQARLKAQASEIEAQSELTRLTEARGAENKYIGETNEMEIAKSQEMAKIETGKFKSMVDALGADTLRAIATAGPEMQVKLLQGLGIKSTLITDGNSPINLFQTAQGLIGGATGQQ